MEETYKNVVGYEGIYQVSNFGNVRRWRKKNKEWFYLKPINHSGGYFRLKLRNKGNDKDVYIHRLVSELFLTGEGNQVNHIDGNKQNNHVGNLERCNSNENVSHAMLKKNTSSKYSGVNFVASRNKFQARLMINGKRKHLGHFPCETSAHLAYLKALKSNNIQNKYASC